MRWRADSDVRDETDKAMVKPQRQSNIGATAVATVAAAAATIVANIYIRECKEYIAIVIHHTIAYFNHVGLTVCHRHLSQFSLHVIQHTAHIHIHIHTLNKQTWIDSTGHTRTHTIRRRRTFTTTLNLLSDIPNTHRVAVASPLDFGKMTFSSHFFHKKFIRSFVRTFVLLLHFIIWLSHLCTCFCWLLFYRYEIKYTIRAKHTHIYRVGVDQRL